MEDRAKAREIALDRVSGYLVTMVNLYHDTMPKSPDAITWPTHPPFRLRDIAGDDPEAMLDMLIEGGYMLVGNARGGLRAARALHVRSAATSSSSGSRRTSTTTRSSR